jgi:hypothetical protein
MKTNNQQVKITRQTVDSDTPLPQVVDELMEIQTRIAVLEAKERNLKAKLINSGLKEICGMNGRAVVSHVDASVTVSWQKVAKHMQVPAEVIQLFSEKKDGYSRVSVYGYN